MSSVFKATTENKTPVTTHFKEINYREQRVYCLSYCLRNVIFTSNVQFVRLAAGRPTQAGDAIDQWRDRWNAAIVCPTQWRLPASADWLWWIVAVDKPFVEGHPKQCNRLDSSPGCLGATCEARWTWRSHAAGTSVCSWLCVTARRPAVDIRARCQHYSWRMWQLL